MKYLAVKNFEQFQHYHDRAPKWIKLYGSVLDDYAFTSLSDAARGQLILIWLLASRHGNRIPNDAAFIARAIHSRRVDLKSLIDAGFLIPCNDEPAEPASKSLASRSGSASNNGAEAERSAIPEREREGEREAETASSLPASEADVEWSALAARLPGYGADIAALRRRLPTEDASHAWLRSFAALLDGLTAAPPEPALVGAALRELVANNAPPHWRLFEGYIASAKRGRARGTAGAGIPAIPYNRETIGERMARRLAEHRATAASAPPVAGALALTDGYPEDD